MAFIPYKYAVKATEDMQVPDEVQAIIKSGADPFEVISDYYNDTAKQLIDAGADPEEVETDRAAQISELARRRQMAPNSDLDEAGRVIGATVIGAVRGANDFVNKVDLLAQDLLGPIFGTNGNARRDVLAQQEKDLNASPIGQFANASPRAQAIGRVGTELGGELGAGSGAGKLGEQLMTKLGGPALTLAQDAALQSATLGLLQDPGKSDNPALDRLKAGGEGFIAGGVSGSALGAIGNGIKSIASPEVQAKLKDFQSKFPLIGNRKAIKEEENLIRTKIDQVTQSVLTKPGLNPSTYADEAWNQLNKDLDNEVLDTSNLKELFLNRAKSLLQESTDKLAPSAMKPRYKLDTQGNQSQVFDLDRKAIKEMVKGGDDNAELALDYLRRADRLSGKNSWYNLREESKRIGRDSFPKPNDKEGKVLRSIYEDYLGSKADELGKGVEYKAAKVFTQEKYAQEKIIDALKAARSPTNEKNINVGTFLKGVQKAIDDDPAVTSPLAREKVRDTIEGLRRLTQQSPQAVKTLKGGGLGGMGAMVMASVPGAAASAGLAYSGVDPKLALIPLILSPIGAKALTSPMVVKALQTLAKSPKNSATAKDITTKLISIITSKTLTEEDQ